MSIGEIENETGKKVELLPDSLLCTVSRENS